MEYFNYSVAILSLIAAILAWIAKIKWSKEYISAKNETIKSKESQIIFLEREIEQYKELTPMKIREYYNSVKLQLEEYIEKLKEKLDIANNEIEQLSIDRELKLINTTKLETEKIYIKEIKEELEQKENDLLKFNINLKSTTHLSWRALYQFEIRIEVKVIQHIRYLGSFLENVENYRRDDIVNSCKTLKNEYEELKKLPHEYFWFKTFLSKEQLIEILKRLLTIDIEEIIPIIKEILNDLQ